ncbi:MAG: Na+/H+ antiporter NhaA [Acidimicrobiia bacterium]|nr:Na+/H+ antiporter NhaA [Acidimicrobiia bacterium]
MPISEQDASPPLPATWAGSDRALARRVVQPLQSFLAIEAAAGVVLLVAAVAALVWANSPWSGGYERLWETDLTVRLGSLELREDLRHWVNDLLMAVFFFVIGLEIKREAVHGSLREPRQAAVPLLCALGGMALPALLYLLVVGGGEETAGWGVPMATDIAFALGVLALLGSRAPSELKVFLLTLAVADDLGAIAVIAVFYSGGIGWWWLSAAVLLLAAVAVLARLEVRHLAVYVLAAGLLWLAVFESGVHATVAGVALGLLTPARPFVAPRRAAAEVGAHLESVRADDIAEESDESSMRHVGGLVDEGVSPLARLEHSLHPWTSFVVLPVFALANAGVDLGGRSVGDVVGDRVSLGVIAGLVLGKPLGVLLAAVVAVFVLRLALPDGVRWRHLAGIGLLAGIGFTVSIFITGLAFDEPALDDAAKLGILAASVLAGGLGAAVLGLPGRRSEDRRRPVPEGGE